MSRNLEYLPERKALLARLVAEGKTLHAMRVEHGFDARTVLRHHPEYRTIHPEDEERETFTPERKALLAKLVEENVSMKRLTSEYHFGYATVRRHYPDYRKRSDGFAGGEVDRTLTDEEFHEKIKPFIEERASSRTIQKALGVNRKRIANHYPEVAWSKEEVREVVSMTKKAEHLYRKLGVRG